MDYGRLFIYSTRGMWCWPLVSFGNTDMVYSNVSFPRAQSSYIPRIVLIKQKAMRIPDGFVVFFTDGDWFDSFLVGLQAFSSRRTTRRATDGLAAQPRIKTHPYNRIRNSRKSRSM
jgi:hypothetical protein